MLTKITFRKVCPSNCRVMYMNRRIDLRPAERRRANRLSGETTAISLPNLWLLLVYFGKKAKRGLRCKGIFLFRGKAGGGGGLV